MASSESWLVTGAGGCIGAWVAAVLLREGARVAAFDKSPDAYRRELIATREELEPLKVVQGDVTDLEAMKRTLADEEITHVVHLAALQAPFCRADPPLGAHVNVTGTVTVLEACKEHGLTTPIAYASSAAVYDEHGAIAPKTIYGVYKVADEGAARIYFQESGLATIGLRPNVVYGPGRDQGMTAGPTLALAAAVKGEPYKIAYGGRTQLQYAPDVARAFVAAARGVPEGPAVYNLGGSEVSMAEVVEAIGSVVPGAEVTFDDVQLPFPPSLPRPWFELDETPLEQGVRETVEVFRRAAG